MKKIIITFTSIIVIILLIDVFIYKSNNDYSKKENALNIVIGSNIYNVISFNEALNIIEDSSGIIYLTTDEDISYTEYINDLSLSLNIENIYYVVLSKGYSIEKLSTILENNVDVKDGTISTPLLITTRNGVLLSVTTLKDYQGYKLDKRVINILMNYKNGNDLLIK